MAWTLKTEFVFRGFVCLVKRAHCIDVVMWPELPSFWMEISVASVNEPWESKALKLLMFDFEPCMFVDSTWRLRFGAMFGFRELHLFYLFVWVLRKFQNFYIVCFLLFYSHIKPKSYNIWPWDNDNFSRFDRTLWSRTYIQTDKIWSHSIYHAGIMSRGKNSKLSHTFYFYHHDN